MFIGFAALSLKTDRLGLYINNLRLLTMLGHNKVKVPDETIWMKLLSSNEHKQYPFRFQGKSKQNTVLNQGNLFELQLLEVYLANLVAQKLYIYIKLSLRNYVTCYFSHSTWIIFNIFSFLTSNSSPLKYPFHSCQRLIFGNKCRIQINTG